MHLLLSSVLAVTLALVVPRPVAAVPDSLLVQARPGDEDNYIVSLAQQVPICANLCIFQAAVAVGCDTDDHTCQCKPSRRGQLRALTENCLTKSCNPGQAAAAHDLTNQICIAVKRGLPVVRRRDLPAEGLEIREALPEPAPAPTPKPMPFIAPVAGAPYHRIEARDTVSGSFASSPTASSIAGTATAPPPSETTSGAKLLHKANRGAALAGAIAVAGALLL